MSGIVEAPTRGMLDLLSEPIFSGVGYGDDVVADTITETRTFLRDSSDGDSDVVFAREVTRNAGGDLLSLGAWSLSNAPGVTDITTDQADDATLTLNGPTQLTIAGENFGAEDDDIVVLVFFRQRPNAGMISPTPFRNRLRVEATIDSISAGDDEIVATITPTHICYADASLGPCQVQVFNKKRLLRSAEFDLTVV